MPANKDEMSNTNSGRNRRREMKNIEITEDWKNALAKMGIEIDNNMIDFCGKTKLPLRFVHQVGNLMLWIFTHDERGALMFEFRAHKGKRDGMRDDKQPYTLDHPWAECRIVFGSKSVEKVIDFVENHRWDKPLYHKDVPLWDYNEEVPLLNYNLEEHWGMSNDQFIMNQILIGFKKYVRDEKIQILTSMSAEERVFSGMAFAWRDNREDVEKWVDKWAKEAKEKFQKATEDAWKELDWEMNNKKEEEDNNE